MRRQKATGSLELLFIRHAQSVANDRGKLAGRLEPNPLSEKGMEQARKLAPLLSEFKPTRVISSPLSRCQQTASLAWKGDLEISEKLIEMDYGRWSGKSLKRLALLPSWKKIQRDPLSFRFPGGESFAECELRLRSLIESLMERGSGRVVVITHGDVIRIMINSLLGRPFNSFQHLQIVPASHSHLSIDLSGVKPLGARIHYLNRTAYSNVAAPMTGYQVGGE